MKKKTSPFKTKTITLRVTYDTSKSPNPSEWFEGWIGGENSIYLTQGESVKVIRPKKRSSTKKVNKNIAYGCNPDGLLKSQIPKGRRLMAYGEIDKNGNQNDDIWGWDDDHWDKDSGGYRGANFYMTYCVPINWKR